MAETKDKNSPRQVSEDCEHVWRATGESIGEEYIHGWIKEYVSTKYTCELCGATKQDPESKRWR